MLTAALSSPPVSPDLTLSSSDRFCPLGHTEIGVELGGTLLDALGCCRIVPIRGPEWVAGHGIADVIHVDPDDPASVGEHKPDPGHLINGPPPLFKVGFDLLEG